MCLVFRFYRIIILLAIIYVRMLKMKCYKLKSRRDIEFNVRILLWARLNRSQIERKSSFSFFVCGIVAIMAHHFHFARFVSTKMPMSKWHSYLCTPGYVLFFPLICASCFHMCVWGMHSKLGWNACAPFAKRVGLINV